MDRPTDILIERLAASVVPVRPLASPGVRALKWLGVAVLWMLAAALMIQPRADVIAAVRDPGFAAQAAVGVATAMVAATAAFASVVPGYGAWRRAALMTVPVIWFIWFAGGAVLAGIHAPLAVVGSECLASLLLFGSVPFVAIAVLLRRGAPLFPWRTLAWGALATGVLADVGTRFCHT